MCALWPEEALPMCSMHSPVSGNPPSTGGAEGPGAIVAGGSSADAAAIAGAMAAGGGVASN
eukprot:6005180-Heterocapsa_arctica.AAC.1